MKALTLSNPISVATSITVRPGSVNSAIARSRRLCSRYCRHVIPVDGAELPAQAPLGDADGRAHGGDRHVGEVRVRVVHHRSEQRVVARREAERRFVLEPVGHEQRERIEEGVGNRVADRPRNRPACAVHDHLADQRRRREDANAVVGTLDHRRIEEHRDRPHPLQRRAMREPGRDPYRLLRRKQIVRAVGLDLRDPLERVLDLVQVVGVPAGDEVAAVVRRTCPRAPASPPRMSTMPAASAAPVRHWPPRADLWPGAPRRSRPHGK